MIESPYKKPLELFLNSTQPPYYHPFPILAVARSWTKDRSAIVEEREAQSDESLVPGKRDLKLIPSPHHLSSQKAGS